VKFTSDQPTSGPLFGLVGSSVMRRRRKTAWPQTVTLDSLGPATSTYPFASLYTNREFPGMAESVEEVGW